MKVLFVCTGNTCRSPMAEALLKQKLPEIDVESAGIFAIEGQQANRHAIEALEQEHGIHLNHHSQPVTESLLQQSDLVLTMTTDHKRALIMQYPDYQAKYYTLKEYISEDDQLWEQFKALSADYEAKRALFIKEQKDKHKKEPSEQEILEHFKKEIAEIKGLEDQLMNYNITDPFGGNLTVYKRTLTEINQYLDQLVDMLADQIKKE